MDGTEPLGFPSQRAAPCSRHFTPPAMNQQPISIILAQFVVILLRVLRLNDGRRVEGLYGMALRCSYMNQHGNGPEGENSAIKRRI